MRVELHNRNGVVAHVDLVGGVAVGSNQIAERTMDETKIVEPGNPPKLVKPADGERYLRALPVCLAGTYFWAELVP